MDSVEPPRPASLVPDPVSTGEPFSLRDSKPTPQPDRGCTPAAMKELLDSDRVNYLVWRLVKAQPHSPPRSPILTPTGAPVSRAICRQCLSGHNGVTSLLTFRLLAGVTLQIPT